MKRPLRMVLYILSVLLIIMVALFMIRAVKENREDPELPYAAEEFYRTEENDHDTEEKDNNTETDSEKGTENVHDLEETAGGGMESTYSTEEASGSDDVTLVFAGDVLLGNAVLANYDAKGISGILSEDLTSEVTEADIFMLNQEFPFSAGGTQMEDKQYTFRTEPSYVSVFTELGTDVVSLANNHILDYGTDALLDTCTTLDEAGILYAGAGENLNRAKSLQIIEKNGKKFGFLAASRVWPVASWSAAAERPGVFGTYDSSLLLEEIRAAEETCDFLTVFVHWGVEYQSTPEEYERTMGKSYVEAGADLVIGAHTHCLQGVEYFDGKPVFYSLGNFIFGMDTDKAAAVKITVEADGNTLVQLLPAASYGAYTYGLTGSEAQNVYQYFEGISYDVSVDDNGQLMNMR